MKFGKSSEGLYAIKKDFFTENGVHLAKQDRISSIYLQQPIRSECKNCLQPISGIDFISHEVPYRICVSCHHLNGMRAESEEFYRAVYHQDGGASYGANYAEVSRPDYAFRMETIYRPKAIFLKECLDSISVDSNNMTICDFGAGSGFFVSALLKEGFRANGMEVSAAQVRLANEMLGTEALKSFDPMRTNEILREINSEILSLIGVLEHLPSPRAALSAVRVNPNIKHVFFSVPMFSPSVYFELLFPRSFNRQLGGSHTHLYSLRSIDRFCREFDFTISGQWLFGTDFMDLYRHSRNNLMDSSVSDAALGFFDEMMLPLIDSLQLNVDNSFNSSEGHFLISKV